MTLITDIKFDSIRNNEAVTFVREHRGTKITVSSVEAGQVLETAPSTRQYLLVKVDGELVGRMTRKGLRTAYSVRTNHHAAARVDSLRALL